jgi:hypothetical protein
MTPSQKIEIINRLEIIDWLFSDDSDDQLRLIINSIADGLLGDDTWEFAPSCDDYEIPRHFKGYGVEWYDLLTGKFLGTFDMGYVLKDIEGFDHLFPLTEGKRKKYVRDWVGKWIYNCQEAFKMSQKKFTERRS